MKVVEDYKAGDQENPTSILKGPRGPLLVQTHSKHEHQIVVV